MFVTQNNIGVFLTVYNEAQTLGELISSIPPQYDVWVVDDGSTDDSCIIAERHGARVLRLPLNIGQGAAAITGYKYLAEQGYRFIIKMDGDGQHDPADIGLFIKALENTRSDMVIGSRILGSNYRKAPLARRIMLKPLTKLLNWITGYNLTDSMCGYRGFQGKSLQRMASIFDRIIEPQYMASELLLRLASAGFKVSEIPVNLKARKNGISYKGLFRYGFGVFITIIKTKIDLYR
jgi:glycosyltransferase involved in cell wall biosynthesis